MALLCCLISYGYDLVQQFRDTAGYVHRILKSEKRSDLPVASADQVHSHIAGAPQCFVNPAFLLVRPIPPLAWIPLVRHPDGAQPPPIFLSCRLATVNETVAELLAVELMRHALSTEANAEAGKSGRRLTAEEQLTS
jgi:hypothetical protein